MSASRGVLCLLALGCGTGETRHDRPAALDTGLLREDPPLNGASIDVGVFACPERNEVPSDFLGFKEGTPREDVQAFSNEVLALAESDDWSLSRCRE